MQHAPHLVGHAGFVVVVAEHGDTGTDTTLSSSASTLASFGGAVVGEVAAQQQRVGGLGCLGEEAAQGAGGSLGAVEVADGGETNLFVLLLHRIQHACLMQRGNRRSRGTRLALPR